MPIKRRHFIHDEAPQHENSVRDLGVNVDSKLNFQIHINDIPSRANALDAIFLIWVHEQV